MISESFRINKEINLNYSKRCFTWANMSAYGFTGIHQFNQKIMKPNETHNIYY